MVTSKNRILSTLIFLQGLLITAPVVSFYQVTDNLTLQAALLPFTPLLILQVLKIFRTRTVSKRNITHFRMAALFLLLSTFTAFFHNAEHIKGAIQFSLIILIMLVVRHYCLTPHLRETFFDGFIVGTIISTLFLFYQKYNLLTGNVAGFLLHNNNYFVLQHEHPYFHISDRGMGLSPEPSIFALLAVPAFLYSLLKNEKQLHHRILIILFCVYLSGFAAFSAYILLGIAFIILTIAHHKAALSGKKIFFIALIPASIILLTNTNFARLADLINILSGVGILDNHWALSNTVRIWSILFTFSESITFPHLLIGHGWDAIDNINKHYPSWLTALEDKSAVDSVLLLLLYTHGLFPLMGFIAFLYALLRCVTDVNDKVVSLTILISVSFLTGYVHLYALWAVLAALLPSQIESVRASKLTLQNA